MLIKLAEYFWFLGLLTAKQISYKTQVYIYKNIALAVLILAVVMVGLIVTPLAGWMLFFSGVVLAPLMIGRIWAGVMTADIAQEILPEAKKEEIHTSQYIARAAGVILFVISPLLIPVLWAEHVASDGANYRLVLLCWIVIGYAGLSRFDLAKKGKK